MVKQAPTFGRLLTMVLFALSCFGILLFLWVSFGGGVPLQPKGYRVKVAFPEATQLGLEADVRVAGVSIGHVRKKDIDTAHPNRTIATLEIDPKYAPLSSDSRVILRQKTLLGETYVELRPGSKTAPKIKEDGWLSDAKVQPTTQLDEVFQAFDPTTRQAFRTWQQDLAGSAKGRGQDINDAFGNLPSFAANADDLLTVLDADGSAVRRLVSNTGVVFGALTQNESQLHDLVVDAGNTFQTTANRQQALADTFQIFPTFLDESKRTFRRLDAFSKDTDPLIQDLRPAVRDLKPTLRDAKALAPDLRTFFTNLDPLITASKTGLPATRDTLDGFTPVLNQVTPFLEQLNPILQWLEYHQRTTADFIANGAGALSDTVPISGADAASGGIGHYLRQFGPKGTQAAAMYSDRAMVPGARGNTYMNPASLSGSQRAKNMMFPNFDCVTSGVKGPGAVDSMSDPACFTQAVPSQPPGNTLKVPHILAADYSK